MIRLPFLAAVAILFAIPFSASAAELPTTLMLLIVTGIVEVPLQSPATMSKPPIWPRFERLYATTT